MDPAFPRSAGLCAKTIERSPKPAPVTSFDVQIPQINRPQKDFPNSPYKPEFKRKSRQNVSDIRATVSNNRNNEI